MAAAVLHLIPAPRRLLRPQHVRRRRRRKLPPLPRGAGEGGTRSATRQTSQENGKEAQK